MQSQYFFRTLTGKTIMISLSPNQTIGMAFLADQNVSYDDFLSYRFISSGKEGLITGNSSITNLYDIYINNGQPACFHIAKSPQPINQDDPSYKYRKDQLDKALYEGLIHLETNHNTEINVIQTLINNLSHILDYCDTIESPDHASIQSFFQDNISLASIESLSLYNDYYNDYTSPLTSPDELVGILYADELDELENALQNGNYDLNKPLKSGKSILCSSISPDTLNLLIHYGAIVTKDYLDYLKELPTASSNQLRAAKKEESKKLMIEITQYELGVESFNSINVFTEIPSTEMEEMYASLCGQVIETEDIV